MFERDIALLVQEILKMKFYPLNTPSDENIDGVGVYRIVSNHRHGDAKLGDFTLRDRTVRFTLLSKSYLKNVTNASTLIAALDGFQGKVQSTEFKMCRVQNEQDMYNQSQDLHEKTIEVSFCSYSDPDYAYKNNNRMHLI